MNQKNIAGLGELTDSLDLVFASLNNGVLVYHAENPDDESKLKLIYANREASHDTGTDLQPRIGKYIFEAFPNLRNSDLARAFMDVVQSREACNIGLVEYADTDMQHGSYSVKAFPLPLNCIGVMFEDIALRKRVDDLLKKQAEDLQTRLKSVAHAVNAVLTESENLRQTISDNLPEADRRTLNGIIEKLREIGRHISS